MPDNTKDSNNKRLTEAAQSADTGDFSGSSGDMRLEKNQQSVACDSVPGASESAASLDVPTKLFMDDDGSITLTEQALLDASGALDSDEDGMTIEGLGLLLDHGTIINNGNGSWTVWSDPDFSGDMQLSFLVSDGTYCTAASVLLAVSPTNNQSVEALSRH